LQRAALVFCQAAKTWHCKVLPEKVFVELLGRFIVKKYIPLPDFYQ
jgi:hypothetical protein